MGKGLPIISVYAVKSGIALYFSIRAMELIKCTELVIKTFPELSVSLATVDSRQFSKVSYNNAIFLYGTDYDHLIGKYVIEGESTSEFLLEKIS